MSRIRVLVVDDSATVRTALKEMLELHEDIEVQTAPDGRVALGKVETWDPDVVTLDVSMPGMDGLTVLRRIMKYRPRPVIMLSAFTFGDATATIKALEWGALDLVHKPCGDSDVRALEAELTRKVMELGRGRARVAGWKRAAVSRPLPSCPPASSQTGAKPLRLVTIGASTGGTEAIRQILGSLPADFPAAIVAVQHMPAGFTRAFAERLNEITLLRVREGSNWDYVGRGEAIIAPGGRHLVLKTDGTSLRVLVSALPPENGHRPSVDVLFRSAAALQGVQRAAVILTGMGHDGAAGMLELRNAGALTIAQSRTSCVVDGMPKSAIEIGGASRVMDLKHIPAMLQAWAAGAVGTTTSGISLSEDGSV